MVPSKKTEPLPPPARKPAFTGPQHLLTLSSVEDDGLGEEERFVHLAPIRLAPRKGNIVSADVAVFGRYS